jgi:hypothetical protein
MFNRIACRSWATPLLSAIVASSALGQQPSARLSGVVRDSAGGAIARAQLTAHGVRGLSDSAGHFALEGLPAGPATLYVRRLGFEPLNVTLELALGRSDSLRIVLTLVAQELVEVVSEADATALTHLAAFRRHREGGMGYYFDRSEITATKAQRLSDLMRRLPGVRLVPDRSGRYQVRMSRANSSSRDCPPDFWIDGIRAAYFNVDDVPLIDIDGLEVYKGASALPPEFLTRVGSPGCGVVVIWTRLPP